MYSKLGKIYKLPLLISVTLGIVILAVTVQREPLSIAMIFLGTILGTFVLDLDYFLYAYFIEPDTDFSRNIRAFTKHGDIFNAMMHIHYHKDDLKEKTLNSALFQVILVFVTYYAVSAAPTLMVRALILSAFVNSIYRLLENYHKDQGLTDWFWIINRKPTKEGTFLYIGTLVLCLVFFISQFR